MKIIRAIKEFYDSRKEILLLIAGGILLIGGIVGGSTLISSMVGDNSRSAYFQTQTAVAWITQTSTNSGPASPTAEFTPTKDSTKNGFELDPREYYVHAPDDPGLENPAIPDRIVIPAIGLDAPVVIAEFNFTNVEGETFGQWLAPSKYAAGWHPSSALLGQVGNTVINGHHNEYGKVFEKIVDLKVGDEIDVYSKNRKFVYLVSNNPMKLLELYQNVETRLNNARWLASSSDERLTLVTCWPPLSNTYRVIVVARPKGD